MGLDEDIAEWYADLSKYCIDKCVDSCCEGGQLKAFALELKPDEVYLFTDELEEGETATAESYTTKSSVKIRKMKTGKFYIMEGFCPLYDEDSGCSVHELPVRPEICRTFPLSVREDEIHFTSKCEIAERVTGLQEFLIGRLYQIAEKYGKRLLIGRVEFKPSRCREQTEYLSEQSIPKPVTRQEGLSSLW